MITVFNHNELNVISKLFSDSNFTIEDVYVPEGTNIYIPIGRVDDPSDYIVVPEDIKIGTLKTDIPNIDSSILFSTLVASIRSLLKKNSYPVNLFIELVEYGLFPNQHDDVIKSLAALNNEIDCNIFMSTNSVYTGIYLNRLLYFYRASKNKPIEKVEELIPRKYWLERIKFYYIMRDGTIQNLIDPSSGLISLDLYDIEVNSVTNKEFEKLLDIEVGQM